jgi:single-stranded DNA-binding protein
VISALISGRSFGAPQERTARNGNTYVTAKVRTPMSNGECAFVNVIVFSDTARAALLALQEGDAVAMTGDLRVSTYIDKTGIAKPSLDLVAHAVLTEYHVRRKREAMHGRRDGPRDAGGDHGHGGDGGDGAAEGEQPAQMDRDFNDEIPF